MPHQSWLIEYAHPSVHDINILAGDPLQVVFVFVTVGCDDRSNWKCVSDDQR